MKSIWLTEKEYNFIYDRVPRVCVDVVIRSRQGVLLTFRNIEPYKNMWHLPGGRLQKGESVIQAVVRLVKKETALDVRVKKLLGFMEFLNEKQYGKTRHSVSLVFMAIPVTKKTKSDFQSTKIQFFKKFPSRTHPIHKKFLRENNIL